jgi:hypothetical protein
VLLLYYLRDNICGSSFLSGSPRRRYRARFALKVASTPVTSRSAIDASSANNLRDYQDQASYRQNVEVILGKNCYRKSHGHRCGVNHRCTQLRRFSPRTAVIDVTYAPLDIRPDNKPALSAFIRLITRIEHMIVEIAEGVGGD